jgi:hypothetical protein
MVRWVVFAAAQAEALRPHIERCIEAGRTSSSAIAADLNAHGIAAPNGGQWFPMQIVSAYDLPGGRRSGAALALAGWGAAPRARSANFRSFDEAKITA